MENPTIPRLAEYVSRYIAEYGVLRASRESRLNETRLLARDYLSVAGYLLDLQKYTWIMYKAVTIPFGLP